MPTSDLEQIFRRYVEEAVNQGDMSVFDELIAPDIVDHDPNAAYFPQDADAPGESGRERAKRHVLDLRAAAPDLRYTLENVVTNGERVEYEWTATGTHRGEYLGFPPTGGRVRMVGKGAARIVDGQIVETWDEWDAQDFIRQLSGAAGAESSRST